MNWAAIGVAAFILSTIVVPIATVTTYDELSESSELFGISSSYKSKVSSKVNKTIKSEGFEETIILPTGKIEVKIKPGFYQAKMLLSNESVSFESDLDREITVRELKIFNATCKITERPEELTEEVWTSNGYLKVSKILGEISEYSNGNVKMLENDLEWCINVLKNDVKKLLQTTKELGVQPTQWW